VNLVPDTQGERKRFAASSGELGLLLWALWDPIGDVPLDEYDTYVPRLWRLLHDHAGVDAIEAELDEICERSIEMDAGTNHTAAERLGKWWYWRFDYPNELEAGT
jgi:hypothetical protein